MQYVRLVASRVPLALFLLLLPAALRAAEAPVPAPVVELRAAPGHLTWQPALADPGGWTLVIGSPDGATARWSFDQDPSLDLDGLERAFGESGELTDGPYTWELRGTLDLDEATRADLAARRERGGPMPDWLTGASEARVHSGVFRVVGGRFADGEVSEPTRTAGVAAGLLGAPAPGGPERAVTTGNLTVRNSLCVGASCLDSETYGTDTVRLKESTLRIHFDDTSADGTPAQDWRVEANSAQLGGDAYFRVVDATANNEILTLRAAARDNAIYAFSNRVGFGTNSPDVELHVRDGDSPTLRLEQDSSSSFAAQTWDVTGNETSFSIRDNTGSVGLPFRIFPDSGSNRLVVRGEGVGISTVDPIAPLHVEREDDARLLVRNTTGTAANRVMLTLQNNGRVSSQYVNTAGETWNLNNLGNGFAITRAGSGVNEMFVQNNGNLTIQGTLTQNSNRETKTAVKAVDPALVLERVLDLPLATWQRKGEDAVTHLGPMAQDFRALFGLGVDDTSIAVVDLAGVALAAIQGQQGEIEALRRNNETLERRNDELEQTLTALTARLAALEERLAAP